MQDPTQTIKAPLANLPKGKWLRKLVEIAGEHGTFQPLGSRHFSTLLIEDDSTLLVTFESVRNIRSTAGAQPLGWELVKGVGWSHLGVISDGETWFRDDHVYTYFDNLTDDGFFDQFEKIIFYGAGACGYAAAAFSVAAPDAIVVAIQPQATLNPSVTEWDPRFKKQRRLDFTSRYGFAPDMLDAADHAYILFDPIGRLDAAHAALFTRSNVTQFRLRYMGANIQAQLSNMKILLPILIKAKDKKLTTQAFAKLYRARRANRNYWRNVVSYLEANERLNLAKMVCRSIVKSGSAPHFSRQLERLNSKARSKKP